ncbi:ABC transporter permease [Sediminispirochaeta bajacaliforniensis]|uniref:ABC transporter permease n=1 Tax=Sediminispirochaeta bajacaliforniensis TaxID=148 RepID=UPI0003709C3D|nr:ABC transporter permease [Sediminispirochaeta bajacaliforniensis]
MDKTQALKKRIRFIERVNWRRFFKKYGLLISFIIMSFIISLLTPNFLTSRNIMNMLRQSSIVGIMAIGTTFVILTGDIDISVGSVLALSGAMVLGLQKMMPWPFAVAITLLVGFLLGLTNGILVSKIKIVGIITTLGTMTIVRGLTYLYTGGYPILGASESFKFIGSGYVGFLPFPVLLFLLLVGFWQFFLSKTPTGRYICAVGGNKEASRLSGIAVDRYHALAFVLGGIMAATSGIVFASRLNSVTPLAGQGYEMDAIASTVIGGTSVTGGEGSIIGTMVGVLILTIINNMFNLLGIQVHVQYLVKGLIILTVVGIDSYSRFGKRE